MPSIPEEDCSVFMYCPPCCLAQDCGFHCPEGCFCGCGAAFCGDLFSHFDGFPKKSEKSQKNSFHL